MATRIVVANFNCSRFLVPYIQKFYPAVTNVRACSIVRSDSGGPGDTVLRRRSRGTHQPGSGPYWCTFVYPPGGMTGWIAGNTIYLYTCNRVSGYYDKDNYYVFEKTPSSMEDTWSRHTSNRRTTCQRYRYVLPRIEGSYCYWQQYLDTYSSLAIVDLEYAAEHMNIDETPTQVRWTTGTNVNQTLNSPNLEERYLAQQIENDCVPNLTAFKNAAFVDAYNHLPAITNNNVETLLAIYNTLKAIVDAYGCGDVSSLARVSEVGSLRDAWMGYRYAYNTTRMDVEETASYIDRLKSLSQTKFVTTHGVYNWENTTGKYTVKCSIQVPTEDITGIYSTLERYGLALDGYNAWDMIPYSFVVDWFLHIGDLLEKARQRRYAARLTPTRTWFSVTHDYTNASGCHQCDYYRWSESLDRSRLATMPASMLQSGGSSGSTWVKRGLDAVCLLS